MTEKPTGKFVIPGDPVKTEKKPGQGLYSEGGHVFAATAGMFKENESGAMVDATNPIVEVKRGDTVIVSVESVKEKVVLVKVMKVVGKQRALPTEDFGVIRVMDIAPGYTEKASDEFKVGDIVKAEVLQVLPNDIVMTTKGPTLGVIEGYCSECRGMLEQDKEGKLVCNICGRTDRRKLSRDYLVKKGE